VQRSNRHFLAIRRKAWRKSTDELKWRGGFPPTQLFGHGTLSKVCKNRMADLPDSQKW